MTFKHSVSMTKPIEKDIKPNEKQYSSDSQLTYDPTYELIYDLPYELTYHLTYELTYELTYNLTHLSYPWVCVLDVRFVQNQHRGDNSDLNADKDARDNNLQISCCLKGRKNVDC